MQVNEGFLTLIDLIIFKSIPEFIKVDKESQMGVVSNFALHNEIDQSKRLQSLDNFSENACGENAMVPVGFIVESLLL